MLSFRNVAGIAAACLALCLALGAPALAVDNEPPSDAPDLTNVRALIKAKSFASARDELLKMADKHQHADVYNLLGFSLRKTGDYERALTYYRKALDHDPVHKSAHEYLGELFVETGQPEKAKAQLAILTRLCPKGCEEREDLENAMRAAGIALPTN
jgi:tetratricopeptide (TPR) repeat protein